MRHGRNASCSRARRRSWRSSTSGSRPCGPFPECATPQGGRPTTSVRLMERWTRFVLRHRRSSSPSGSSSSWSRGWASSKLSGLLTNRFTLPGTDAAARREDPPDSFGQRSTGSFTLVVADATAAASIVCRGASRGARGRAELPTGGSSRCSPWRTHVSRRRSCPSLDPADAKGHTGAMRAPRARFPARRSTSPGRRRSSTISTPCSRDDLKKGELYIAIPIALVLLVFTFGTLSFLLPFVFALVTIPATLGIVWIVANHMELTTYITNLVIADRARDRDRLLAADRLPLPRGAPRRDDARRGDRADDGHGGARRRLLRHGGRDRARVAALHAAAVHARLRRRRPDHPARLGRRRGDVPARAAVAPRPPARPRPAAAARPDRAAGRPRARLLGAARRTIMRRPVAGRDRRRPRSCSRWPPRCSTSSSGRDRTRASRRASSRSRGSTS